MNLRRKARDAADAVMTSTAPGARASVAAQAVAHTAANGGSAALAAAAGAAGALVVAAEQLYGNREDGEYATFRTDKEN